MADSLQQRLLSRLEMQADSNAIAFYGGEEPMKWLSVDKFFSRAAGQAEALAELGLGRGDVCVLVLASRERCATLLTATLLLGGIPLLVAPPILQNKSAYSSLEVILREIVRKTRPRVVVCPDQMKDLGPRLDSLTPEGDVVFEGELPSLSKQAQIDITLPPSADLAAMQLTSGTTGFPRICVWRQRQVLAGLDGIASAMSLSVKDVCLNWTPLYHDMGLINNFLLCLTAGIPLVQMDPVVFVKKPAIWLNALSESGATITWSPNFGYALAAERIRDSEISNVRLDRVRAFWNAAERIHHDTMSSFCNRFAPYGVSWEALKTNYGCAEAVGGVTFSDPTSSSVIERVDRSKLYDARVAELTDETEAEERRTTIVGVGQPYEGMQVRILSEERQELPDGHVGQIALATASRMEAYLGDEEATEQVIHGEYLLTGDLGYLRRGELFWVGRLHERITVRGKKFDPSDFERPLMDVPGLREGSFAAFGVPDETYGTQRVILVTEVRDSTLRQPQEISSDIRMQAQASLGVTVSEIVLVREGVLTKTSSGKRRHRLFRRLFMEGKLGEHEWHPRSTVRSESSTPRQN